MKCFSFLSCPCFFEATTFCRIRKIGFALNKNARAAHTAIPSFVSICVTQSASVGLTYVVAQGQFFGGGGREERPYSLHYQRPVRCAEHRDILCGNIASILSKKIRLNRKRIGIWENARVSFFLICRISWQRKDCLFGALKSDAFACSPALEQAVLHLRQLI